MPDKPVPLREALKEAVEELVHLTEDFLPHDTYAEAEWIDQIGRVNARIEHVPADIETHDAE